jgi:putative lipoprotein
MKSSPFTGLMTVLALLLLGGCAYVEISPVGADDRSMTGKVTYVPADPVPEGSVLSIRVVDNSKATSGPVLLGQQRVAIAGSPPFEFRAEYRADDTLLRRGVNVEAKILVNGKLRYGNLTSYVVTLNRASSPQEITLMPTAP